MTEPADAAGTAHAGSTFFRELAGLNIAVLREYLATSDAPFEESQLYDSVKDTKIIDQALRRSKFRLFKTDALFDLIADDIVKELNRQDDDTVFSLVRNDITHIVYGEGDFFKRHADYLSVTSNVIEEYTLLVNVTPDGIETTGGETLIHTWPDRVHRSNATTAYGCGLLFRKDLDHEGAVVLSGEKHIVSVNLWAMPKSSADRRVLHVTFPAQIDANGMEAAATTGRAQATTASHGDVDQRPVKRQRHNTMAAGSPSAVNSGDAASVLSSALRAVATAEAFAIPVATVLKHECHLAALIRFHDNQEDVEEKSLIIHHECTDCTYEEFFVIYKILLRSYVSAEEIRTHAMLIDYYLPGVDKQRRLLVDVAESIDQHDEEPLVDAPQATDVEQSSAVEALMQTYLEVVYNAKAK
jgi:hypothetical protein